MVRHSFEMHAVMDTKRDELILGILELGKELRIRLEQRLSLVE